MNVAADPLASSIFVSEDRYEPDSVPAPPVTPREQARRYCILLFLLPLLAIPACIRLGASDFFLRYGASRWVQSNDSVFDIHDRVCDVLVYGDSTAMTGIDPEVVQRNTGFRTCNIAVTNSVLAVTGNLTLDRYLDHNTRPRVILIQLSPDGFQPESYSWRQTVYAEGLVELLRHGSPVESRRVLLAHPQESIAFAGYVAGFSAYAVLKDVLFHTTHIRPDEDTVTIRNGFFTPPAPPSKGCEPGAVFSNPQAGGNFPRTLVSEFQSQYASRSGIVLVNVAPIPSCDQNLAAFSSELKGITSNALTPLPVGLFNDPRHYTAVGSAIVSRLVAHELNIVAERTPALDAPPAAAPPQSAVATLRHARLGR
ncbi:MAG: hypothetical protein M3O02_07375 [Acidobacteriota bacterium]|nr:hypothetical protein [Acidobacteriota bacterium]